MPDLSIVIPTCNRAVLLQRCLNSIKDGVRCDYEIIVVDGASGEETTEVLTKSREFFGARLRIVREQARQGFVFAANLGLRAGIGRNLIWLNDDVRPLPGALDAAVAQIDNSEAALLAMFHRSSSPRNTAFEATVNGSTYRLLHIRGTLYANFPIGRRDTFEKLGFLDEGFYFYGADPDLSLKAWSSGLSVQPAWGVYLDHDEHEDDRRETDATRANADNRRLFEKWNLPAKNLARNDFDPTNPCTLKSGATSLLSPPLVLRGRGRVGAVGEDANLAKPSPRSSPGVPGEEERANPTISFVLATYNRREVILQTLRDLRAALIASGISCETIVIDNASRDGTARAVATEFPNVQTLRQSRNLGPCAKNLGIAKARGQYIVFLDDDAAPTAQSLPNLIAHFQADPLLGAASFDAVLPDGSHECSAYPSVFIGCGVGFRASALAQTGGLPEDFFMAAEEYDLSFRLLARGWKIRRFSDLRVNHRKTPSSRFPARITRLDVRNNLCLTARYFPRKWALPYAIDWMRRYRWIAQSKGREHVRAFWLGLAEGIYRSFPRTGRKKVSEEIFQRFAMIDEIRGWMQTEIAARGYRRIVLLDVGKNIYAFLQAARSCGLQILAIADPKLTRPGRRYRGISVVDDTDAAKLTFDAAVIANTSPVHVGLRRESWAKLDRRPLFDVFTPTQERALAA